MPSLLQRLRERKIVQWAVVYLAGVLLPCLVTLYTIGREMRWGFAAKLCLRQMAWASVFALMIAWAGTLVF